MSFLKKLWCKLLDLLGIKHQHYQSAPTPMPTPTEPEDPNPVWDGGGGPPSGWIPDHTDLRDYVFEERSLAKDRSTLPAEVDLRARFRTAVENQGSTNSCVGHATTSALEAVLRSTVDRSRLFVYWNARSFEGTTASDPGCQIRNAMRGVSTYGASTEALWPWNTSALRTKPSAAAYTDGLTVRPMIASYQRVTTVLGLKEALAKGLPVVFGFSMTHTFVYSTGTTGHLPYPATGEKFYGGHAVVAVGYSDAMKTVLVRNSYGSGWGKDGYFTMDYKWFDNMNGLVADAWVIVPK
jgi:C1A family cysteine protease